MSPADDYSTAAATLKAAQHVYLNASMAKHLAEKRLAKAEADFTKTREAIEAEKDIS